MHYDFDTTATSPVLPEVLAIYARHLEEDGNNPASMHGGGIRALDLLGQAKSSIAKDLDCAPDEIYFTSGGTESINHALKGVAWSGKRGSLFVTSTGEHDAVRTSLSFLKEQWDQDVRELPLLKTGTVDMGALESLLSAEAPRLLSIMGVSNETGAINDLKAIQQLLKKYAPRCLFHSDIVQAAGKLPLSFKQSGLDMASVSGHKLGAPKGTGLLLKKKSLRLVPLLHGGGQQDGVRSGTVDVPGALAIALAIRLHVERLDENLAHVTTLKKRFLKAIHEHGLPHECLSPEDASPYVLSIAFLGLRGETLMHALSAESIYISTGAACGSRHAGENHVLAAMGIEKPLIESAVRISFSSARDEQDVLWLADTINRIYRRYATG